MLMVDGYGTWCDGIISFMIHQLTTIIISNFGYAKVHCCCRNHDCYRR